MDVSRLQRLFSDRQDVILRLVLLGFLLQFLLAFRLFLHPETGFRISLIPLNPEGWEIRALLVTFGMWLMWATLRLERYTLEGIVWGWVLLSTINLNAWQPYFWQFWLIIIFYLLSKKHFITLLLIGQAGFYIWSGLHKLNPFFVSDLTYLLESKMEGGTMQSLSVGVIPILPWLEIAAGSMILWKKTRTIGLLITAGLHVGIAVLMSPVLLDFNHIIIPWNLVLAALSLLLIGERIAISRKSLLPVFVVLGALWIFPIFNAYTGRLSYFSANLYSGRTFHAEIILSEPGSCNLITHELDPEYPKSSANLQREFILYNGVAALPEPAYYEHIFQEVYCKRCGQHTVRLLITRRDWDGEESYYIDCE